MILSITSLTLKLAALARGGKSLKLSMYRADEGLRRNKQENPGYEPSCQRGHRPPRHRGSVIGLL